MKLTKILLCAAVASAMAFASSKATASTLNISGVVKTFGTTRTTSSAVIVTTKTVAFNNKTIYLALSNAIASAHPPAGLAQNLPKDGIIGFNPNAFDGNDVRGVFYVTNAPGKPFFYFALAGTDTNGDAYSYIELDTESELADLGYSFFEEDEDVFNWVYSYVETSKTFQETSTSAALLYIHDNPYDWDDAEFPWEWSFNSSFAIEIRGVMILNFNSNNTTDHVTVSLKGTGSSYTGGDDAVVTSGSLSFSGNVLED